MDRTVHISSASRRQTRSSTQNADLSKLFIKCGYKGIVIKLWSSKSIARFVRGGKHARVELLARYISTNSQFWSTTFGMFRFFFGLEDGCTDPDYDTPTSGCLASTGTSMFLNQEKYIGQRLPPRTTVQWHGKNSEIVVIHIEQNNETRGSFPKFSPTTPAMSPELTFHLPPLECSIFIRTSAMVQQKTTYRKVSCRSLRSTTAMQSQATPTSPQIRSVSYPFTILSTAS